MKRIILTLCMTMIACITAFAQKALFDKYSETMVSPLSTYPVI